MFERPSDEPLHHLSKFHGAPFGFVPPPFEQVVIALLEVAAVTRHQIMYFVITIL